MTLASTHNFIYFHILCVCEQRKTKTDTKMSLVLEWNGKYFMYFIVSDLKNKEAMPCSLYRVHVDLDNSICELFERYTKLCIYKTEPPFWWCTRLENATPRTSGSTNYSLSKASLDLNFATSKSVALYTICCCLAVRLEFCLFHI